MGTMTWIYAEYPPAKPPPPREPWPEWDFMVERSAGLESHRQPEAEPHRQDTVPLLTSVIV